MNPGPPAPQASVIIRTRLRAHTTRLYDKPKSEQAIINTLVKLKASGIEDGTLKQVDNQLRNLAKQADLFNPEEVKTAVANYKNNRTKKPVENSYKTKRIRIILVIILLQENVVVQYYILLQFGLQIFEFLNQEIWDSSVDTQRYS